MKYLTLVLMLLGCATVPAKPKCTNAILEAKMKQVCATVPEQLQLACGIGFFLCTTPDAASRSAECPAVVREIETVCEMPR